MGQTITEKIFARAVGREKVTPWEVVYPAPDIIVIHEGAFPGFIDKLKSIGVNELWDPDRTVVVVDHEPVAESIKVANRMVKLRKYVEELGVKQFYDLGNHGLSHILPIEEGIIKPGMFVHSYDTHCPNIGAVGSFASPVVYEFPAVLAKGKLWMYVPSSLKINLKGTVRPGVMSRDISQYAINQIGWEKSDYRVYEFVGPALKELNVDQRMTLCNITMESGAKTGIVNPDDIMMDYYKGRTSDPLNPLYSDPDAEYEEEYEFDVSELIPQLAVPPTSDTVEPVTSKLGVKVNQAFIGSCANGSITDLRAAAKILEGRQIAPHVRFIITPGTQKIFIQALKEGLVDIFAKAGAVVTPAGCGACPGSGSARLGDGEVCVATTTRNDPGRMGSDKADIFLGNAMTVAASAVKGEVADPRDYL